MNNRFVSIWFRYLNTDWFTSRQPHLLHVPFVLRTNSHGRMMITAVNAAAEIQGIKKGMVLADARAMVPELEVSDDIPDLSDKLLHKIAKWCIRFTPIVSVDSPDGLLLDVTGCTHLWGGDSSYVSEIVKRLKAYGYEVRTSIADTIGVAWGIARFGRDPVVKPGHHIESLMDLPPEALRLESDTIDRLHKLGLHQVKQFVRMPSSSLRRRFGPHFMMRLNTALGQEMEILEPVKPVEPYQERLPCLEPIVTATGIQIALRQLLEILCTRLQQEQKGLRTAVFKSYRVDGKVEQLAIGTHRPSQSISHLFKLFENKLTSIEPALGIDLFVLEAGSVEDFLLPQEKMWGGSGGLNDPRLSELIDRLANRVGTDSIHRYIPDEHYWPERAFKLTSSLNERPTTAWRSDKLRPMQIFSTPECIEVTAPIPDYPPMLFRYKGKLHQIVKADGPERIEQEWWLQQGQHRDYYRVEDVDGYRYWIFRLGHYHDPSYQWFIHGYFV